MLGSMAKDQEFHARGEAVGQTLGGAVRQWMRGMSTGEVKRLLTERHVQVNGNLCVDELRRLKEGDVVHVFEQPRAAVPTAKDVRVRYVDADLMVVEKPAGMTTLRHAEEKGWDDRRRQKQLTLEEVLQGMLPGVMKDNASRAAGHPLLRKKAAKSKDTKGQAMRGGGSPRVRAVHRLDRDTSGLMIFALSTRAEQALVAAFKGHAVQRAYLAVAHGRMKGARMIESWIVRDRGDGMRGSDPRGADAPEGQRAVTHLEVMEPLGDYTVVRCRLETGRTHQIRIHLAESGHMLCGERVYVRPAAGRPVVDDESEAPRHALHSAELEFVHPVSGARMKFSSSWPADLAKWLEGMRTRHL